MALEAVVFPQDLFGHSSKELYNLLGGNWSAYDLSLEQQQQQREEDNKGYNNSFDFLENQAENFLHHGDNWSSSPPPPPPPSSMVPHFNELHLANYPSSSDAPNNTTSQLDTVPSTTMPPTRAKRRRSRSRKNKEEIENQRMTHIAVERNRRKQMNEYLSVLRSLMPESYVQRVYTYIHISLSFTSYWLGFISFVY